MLLWNTLTFVVNIFYYVFALVFTLLYFTFTCILWLNAAVRQKHRGNIWEASNIFESLVVILLAAGVVSMLMCVHMHVYMLVHIYIHILDTNMEIFLTTNNRDKF